MKGFLIAIVFILSISAATHCAGETLQQNTAVNNDCTLKFGWINWEPLQYLDQQGNLVGIQIDLVKAIAEKLNCRIIFVNRNWGDIIDDIQIGKIDFTANASIADYRKKFAYFSNAYRRDTFGVYVRSDSLAKFNVSSIDELKKTGFKLGLTNQHLYSNEIDSWKNDPLYAKNLSYAEATNINMQRVINNEIDGCLDDPFIVAYQQRTGSLPHDIERLPIGTFGHKVSFMFSKKTVHPEFIVRFNQVLNEIKDAPEFQSIWLNSQF